MPVPAKSTEVVIGRQSRWGLFRRRPVWLPTVRGGIVLLTIAVLAGVVVLRGSYPFLAVNAPVHDGALVVEGWLPDYALQEALAEFRRNPYERLYVTGGPLEAGGFLSEFKTYAQLGAATLRKLGMREDQLDAVPAPLVRQDRTYVSAVALKNWLHEHGRVHRKMNVMSLGPHARRTRLLFEKAMGDEVTVGITALEDRNYNSKKWWTGSYGLRAMVDEWVAYGYARLLFRPPSEQPGGY